MSLIWAIGIVIGVAGSDCTSPDRVPKDLRALVSVATRHRLPMPPKTARLILAHTQSWTFDYPDRKPGGRDAAFYSPAFLVEETADGSIVVHQGWSRKTLRPMRDSEPLWRTFSAVRVKPSLAGYATSFGTEQTLVCAAQLSCRGQYEEARTLLRLFGEDDAYRRTIAPLILASSIADYQEQRILQGPSAWEDVRSRLQFLFTDFPDLKHGSRLTLFEDLAETLSAKSPTPGTVEAHLYHWSRQPTDLNIISHKHMFGRGSRIADAPARTIILQGFQAIPDLIAHLDGRRITAHGAYPGEIERVGDLAAALLQEIAGKRVDATTAEERATAWQTWWKGASTHAERDYLTEAVFQVNGERVTGVNESVAWIIASRYPTLLPHLCVEFSKRAGRQVSPLPLAKAVAGSRLSQQERVSLLVQFSEQKSLVQRCQILMALVTIDEKVCARLLLPILATMPRMGPTSPGVSPEVLIASIVIDIEDHKVWREYLRVAKRVSSGMRLEIISQLSDLSVEKHLRLRVAFLAAFLNDCDVRDSANQSDQADAIWASFDCPEIAVRDFAAIRIASLRWLDDSPNSHWNSSQWARFRKRVRYSLTSEQLPTL